MNLYLIRHGETDWNLEGRFQGHTDIPLNAHGREQIAGMARILEELPFSMDLIVSSPLSRARESAEIIAEKLSYPKEAILTEPLLTERFFGAAEGLTAPERKEKYPDGNFPGMETLEELFCRAGTAFEKLARDYGDRAHVLAVAHGAILNAVLTVVTKGRIPYPGEENVQVRQGEIYRIQCSGKSISAAKLDVKK